MKWIKDYLKERYRGLTMQKKLVLSFSVPLIIICMLITMVCSPVLSHIYQEQVQYSVGQSCSQVSHYITHNIENMYYLGQLIAQNGEINRVLGAEQLGQYSDMAEAYREFYEMNQVFNNIEMTNSTYRIGLYLPEQLAYSNNHYYFYPESQLQKRQDYEQMMDALNKGKLYYSVMEEAVQASVDQNRQYITLFASFIAGEHTYVTKVGIPLDEICNVLKTAQITPNNLIYLLDEKGEMLAVSEKGIYEKLQGSVPTAEQESWNKIWVGNTQCYVIYQQVDHNNWQIFSLIPVEDYKELTSFVHWLMILVTVLLIVAIVVVSNLLSRYYVKRLAKVNEHMKNLENGDLNTQMNTSYYSRGTGDEIDEIYANFNNMAVRLQQLMKSHYKLGKSVMSAELRALQAQINPHFLYNTLDLINWGAIEHGANEVAEMARNLGLFYRLSLNHGKTAILIKEELKHVEAYMNIESMHFPGAITLQIDVPQEIREYACLNIILQPFVENAIVHGIAEHSDIIECTIRISAVKEEENIIFTVEDDGPGIEPEKLESILKESNSGKENGYGVKNTNFRIKLCYGDSYGVRYESHVAEGTKVFIKIPAYTYEELDEILK